MLLPDNNEEEKRPATPDNSPKSPPHKRQKLASMFVIDWRTGQRKLTKRGPTLGDGAIAIMESEIDPP